MTRLYAICALLIACYCCAGSNALGTNERATLLNLLKGPCTWPSDWTESSLPTNGNCPSWTGLFCNSDANVSTISLTDHALSCPFPVPVVGLPRLGQLILARCNLTGVIPDDIYTPTIEMIDLRGNQLTGTISPLIGSCSKLTYYNIKSNYITGTIPAEILDTNVVNFIVAHNYLECPIPRGLIERLEAAGQFCSFINNNFGTPGVVGVCGWTNSTRNCRLLPSRVADYTAAKNFTTQPDYILENAGARIEIRGRSVYAFAKTSSGDVYRDEYVVNEFYGLQELPEPPSSISPYPGDEYLVQEFHFTKFEAPVLKPGSSSAYTLRHALPNGAIFELELHLAPSATSLLKYGWTIRSWPFASSNTNGFIATPLQATLRWQMFGPNGEFACDRPLDGIAILPGNSAGCNTDTSSLNFNIDESAGVFTVGNPRVRMVTDLPYGIYVDSQEKIILPAQMNIAVMESGFPTLKSTGGSVDSQHVSFSCAVATNIFVDSVFYDPDISIQLLFDVSSPEDPSNAVAVGVGVGVSAAIVVAGVVAVVTIKPLRKKLLPFRDRDRHESGGQQKHRENSSSALVPPDGSKWTPSSKPEQL